VPARATYSEPVRPLVSAATAATVAAGADIQDGLLHIEDVQGKRIVATRLRANVTIREDNATAALEAMSRFGADPRWLIYLPPTMAPTETSRRDGYLERPEEAFAHFDRAGVGAVVCEQKHMGSRAVVVVCRDAEAARARFGVDTGESGICTTRTGRRFLTDARLEAELLEQVRDAASAAGLWDELGTDWLCLDCELMPWSLKAQELLRQHYAPVAAAAGAALGAARERASHRSPRSCASAKSSSRATRAPIATTAGPSSRSPTCASRRSTCSPARARSTPGRATSGTCAWPRGSPRRRAGA
jgi:protein phosphatase